MPIFKTRLIIFRHLGHTAQPDIDRVMGKHDFVGKTQFTEFSHVFYVDIKRRNDIQADPIEGNVHVLGENGLMVFDIFGVGYVADHDFSWISVFCEE